MQGTAKLQERKPTKWMDGRYSVGKDEEAGRDCSEQRPWRKARVQDDVAGWVDFLQEVQCASLPLRPVPPAGSSVGVRGSLFPAIDVEG